MSTRMPGQNTRGHAEPVSSGSRDKIFWMRPPKIGAGGPEKLIILFVWPNRHVAIILGLSLKHNILVQLHEIANGACWWQLL